MPFTVCGSWAAFLYALQGVFSLCWAFSFCVGVRIYAAELFGRCTAFLAALRWCFRFGVAFVALLFVLLCSVMPLKPSVLRFVGVGSVFIPPKNQMALKGFILALTAYLYFTIFLQYNFHFLPFFAFWSQVG